jgi:hypothetical protein
MSNLGMGLIGPMGPIGLMVQKPVMKTTPVQRDSGNSNLKVETENGPVQRDSGNSKLGVLGILRSLGILGWKTVRQEVRRQKSGVSV